MWPCSVLQRTHKQLANPVEVARLPPIPTFQPVVDNTVTASAIVTLLYDRLPDDKSKLVVYDINRNTTALHLMKTRVSGSDHCRRVEKPVS